MVPLRIALRILLLRLGILWLSSSLRRIIRLLKVLSLILVPNFRPPVLEIAALTLDSCSSLMGPLLSPLSPSRSTTPPQSGATAVKPTPSHTVNPEWYSASTPSKLVQTHSKLSKLKLLRWTEPLLHFHLLQLAHLLTLHHHYQELRSAMLASRSLLLLWAVLLVLLLCCRMIWERCVFFDDKWLMFMFSYDDWDLADLSLYPLPYSLH